jgi:hypothetical protein
MTKAQWILIITLAASFYGVGNIWMTQCGWRLWTYVDPADFGAYHNAWWAMIKPVVFPVAGVAVLGSIALIWWRPEGVTATPVWLNLALHVATYTGTAVFWGRWQAQTHLAKMPDGSLDPTYMRAMSTHWIRSLLITLNGLAAFWMMVEHLSSRSRVS